MSKCKRRRLMAQFSIDYINGDLFDQSSTGRLWLAGITTSATPSILHAHGATTDATSMAGIYNFMLNPACH